jgi:hypothetical protein
MRKRLWIIVLAALTLLAGCERRPLENIYRSTVRVIVKCIWSVSAYPEGIKPTGVTMYFFRDGEYYTTLTTANVDSCEVQLPEGRYRMYMITQSPEEYWKLQFDHMTDFSGAETTLRPTSASWISRGANEEVVENPEVICAGVSEEFEITTKMTEDYQYYYTYLKKMMAAANADTKAGYDEEISYYKETVEYYTIRIPVYPKSIVSQMWVSIYAEKADLLKSVRASTSGMAKSFEITKDVTGSDEAIQVISDWKLSMDDTPGRIGHVDGIITTFGLPNGEVPNAKRDSTLNVSALLIDNATTKQYTFNTGNKIKLLAPNPGYRAMYRLVIGSVDDPAITDLPVVEPPDGKSSGMDAKVEDWEEGPTIEIPM